MLPSIGSLLTQIFIHVHRHTYIPCFYTITDTATLSKKVKHENDVDMS